MAALVLGLVLFLGVHSVRVFAEDWRRGVIARRGEKAYKGVYTLLSIAGIVLIVWGFGQARQNPVMLWPPQTWARHLSLLLVALSFVVIAAAYVPANHIKARLHHPMVLGVKLWAFGHLLANNMLHDVVFFGAFLVWAVLSFRAARMRDRAAGAVYAPGTAKGTLITVVAGLVAAAVFALWIHGWMTGVRPF
jgi:uncharacterized membrane protein